MNINNNSGKKRRSRVRLNTPYNCAEAQRMYADIFGEPVDLAEVVIDEDQCLLSVKGRDILIWDNHLYTSSPAINSMYLATVKEALQHAFDYDQSQKKAA